MNDSSSLHSRIPQKLHQIDDFSLTEPGSFSHLHPEGDAQGAKWGEAMAAVAALSVKVLDYAPRMADVCAEIMAGLALPDKHLPAKLLYDAKGARLFERICEQDEYYLQRVELQIIQSYAAQMVEPLGEGSAIIQYGAGATAATQQLLGHAHSPDVYVLIDILRERLVEATASLSQDRPDLRIMPICADYSRLTEGLEILQEARNRAVFFPGAAIGKCLPHEAQKLLQYVGRMVGPGGRLLVGVDLQKDTEIIEAAYNDAQGFNAALNVNLLNRLNNEFGADFDLTNFGHRAIYRPDLGRMEMHLVSLERQRAMFGGHVFLLDQGEYIVTDYAHKYTLEGFRQLAGRAGWCQERVWTDPDELYSLQLYRLDDI